MCHVLVAIIPIFAKRRIGNYDEVSNGAAAAAAANDNDEKRDEEGSPPPDRDIFISVTSISLRPVPATPTEVIDLRPHNDPTLPCECGHESVQALFLAHTN
ncbi:hypothetical protein ACHAW5_001426 [Stephanodiscus triporus]|uniref:Uncharacterized protein n=1 Tax=Stephanodiscus triporus TaxID=2934178 RepID=A0ABD3MQD4_9STRA